MIAPVLPTYARADVEFVRGEGVYVYTADGTRYLDFAAGIAVNALGHAHPHLVKALTEQAGGFGTRPTSIACRGRSAWPGASSRRASPTRCSSRTPASRRSRLRSRWRGASNTKAAIPSASAPSPSKARSTAARWPPSPPADRRNISKVRAQDRRLRPGRVRRRQAGRGGDCPRDRRDPDRAGAGRGGLAPRDAGIPARLAAPLRRARVDADLRRGSDRRRPHRQAVRA